LWQTLKTLQQQKKMWQRVLLVALGHGVHRHFYVLRKHFSLYQDTFWDDRDTQWSDSAINILRNAKMGAIVALRSPLSLDTGNTFQLTAAELYSLVTRLGSTKHCALEVTAQHLTERDTEIINALAKPKQKKNNIDQEEKDTTP